MLPTQPHAPRRSLPSLTFPTLLLAPSLGVVGLIGLGLAPPLALTVAVLTLIGSVALVETRWPFRAAWRSDGSPAAKRETVTDVLYIAFASAPDRLARVGVEAGALLLLGLSRSAEAGPWPEMLLGAALAFLVADLGKYLIHRASHTHPWLFRFHLAHHQPSRVVALNALRLHPVNLAYNAVIDTVPLLIFGVSPAVGAVLATLRATVGVVQHANLDLERGRQWLVNAPSYHRVHHDVDAARANHNFASTLLVWDRLFGTLRRAPAPDEVGVAETDHHLPRGFLGQLFYPFCGKRLAIDCLLARCPRLIR